MLLLSGASMKLTIQVQYLPIIPTIEGVLVWSEKWIVRYSHNRPPLGGPLYFGENRECHPGGGMRMI